MAVSTHSRSSCADDQITPPGDSGMVAHQFIPLKYEMDGVAVAKSIRRRSRYAHLFNTIGAASSATTKHSLVFIFLPGGRSGPVPLLSRLSEGVLH